MTPMLFTTGCMQEKVANVSPSKLKQSSLAIHSTAQTQLKPIETNATHIENHTILSQTDTTESEALLSDYSEYAEILELSENNSTMLEHLIGLSEEMTSEERTGEDSSTAQNDWQEITKEEEIISTAMAYLDTKYVWAANGPTAFDCSGFTKYVYKENGMTLPRYSGHQAKVGMKISYDELQKGDLVFFDTEKKYTQRVNHVGIYIGDGQFIHASSAKKKVIITSFKKKRFYKNRFLWGQRVIDSDATYTSL